MKQPSPPTAPLSSSPAERVERIVPGMAAAAAAFLMFAIMNAFAKFLSARHSVIEIAFYRNVVACIPFAMAAVAMRRRNILAIQSKPRIIVLRAMLGTLTLTVTFAALALMPLADAAVLMFTASLFVPIFGVILLRESVGPWRWSAVVVGFIGVAIMLSPSGNSSRLGVALALAAAVLQAVMSILLRHLGGHERPETTSFYFFIIGTLITGLAMPFVATAPSPDEVPLLVGIGLSGAAAQWLYSVAFRHTPAAVVAVINYTSIVWATLFGWLIWNDWPLPAVFVGAGVVIACNALIAWRESRRH